MPSRTLQILAAVTIACCGTAQESKPPAPPAAPAEQAPTVQAPKGPHFLIRQYPRDRDVPVAVVAGRTVTLGNVVDHIERRHHPGFKRALEVQPGIQRMLQSDLIAPWVRHFADLEALKHSLGDEQPDATKLEAAQSETLKARFQNFLDTYVADLKSHGRPSTLSQDKVNKLLADFQLNNGLSVELQGMLDFLEPGEYTRGQLHGFFTANPRTFGGQVTIAHILVQHRDAGTGILLNDEGLALATTRLADIKARLQPDGSNFEEVARMFSDDTRTGKDGGRLEGVYRYDDRLPAALCRAAWSLRDGEISDVVETQYGWHLVKRIEMTHNVMILFTDDAMPAIKTIMRRARQEDLLFQAREKAAVRLLL
jgi:hypothetical protein